MMERRRGEEARRSANPFTIGVCTWTDEDLDRFQRFFRQYQSIHGSIPLPKDALLAV